MGTQEPLSLEVVLRAPRAVSLLAVSNGKEGRRGLRQARGPAIGLVEWTLKMTERLFFLLLSNGLADLLDIELLEL